MEERKFLLNGNRDGAVTGVILGVAGNVSVRKLFELLFVRGGLFPGHCSLSR